MKYLINQITCADGFERSHKRKRLSLCDIGVYKNIIGSTKNSEVQSFLARTILSKTIEDNNKYDLKVRRKVLSDMVEEDEKRKTDEHILKNKIKKTLNDQLKYI